MKKLLITLGLVTASMSAHAITVGNLEVYNQATVNILAPNSWGPISSIPDGGYTSGYSGTMRATKDGLFTATYLGQVATYANFFLADGAELNGGRAAKGLGNPISGIGNTVSAFVGAGQDVNFSFGQDNDGNNVADGPLQDNGDVNSPGRSSRGILFFLNSFALTDGSGRLFDFLIGYNDTAGDKDYDDYVVGVRHVPVPAALPLLATALGLFGLSRRKNKLQA